MFTYVFNFPYPIAMSMFGGECLLICIVDKNDPSDSIKRSFELAQESIDIDGPDCFF